MYIADSRNCRIRRVRAGVITTFAGSGTCGFADGAAATARFNEPEQMQYWNGSLFVADKLNCRIRKVVGGIVSTIAGNGTCLTSSGDGGLPLAAAIGYPTGLVVDGSGAVFVTDGQACTVRRVDATSITTSVGNGVCNPTGVTAPPLSIGLARPQALALNNENELIITDLIGCRIWRVGGNAQIVVGDGVCTNTLYAYPYQPARVSYPSGVAVDTAGHVLAAAQYMVASVTPGVTPPSLSFIVNNGPWAYPPFEDDEGVLATRTAVGLAHHARVNGDVVVLESCRIRVVRSGVKVTIAGKPRTNAGCPPSSGDGGPASAAGMAPQDVVEGAAGELLFTDYGGNGGPCTVRRIAPDGVVTTIAGNGACGSGPVTSSVPASAVSLWYPTAIAYSSADGTVYIATRCQVLALQGGVLAPVAGTGTCGYSGDDGPATAAGLDYVNSVAVQGNDVFISFGNDPWGQIPPPAHCLIRRVRDGVITTAAGTTGCGGGVDGPATAQPIGSVSDMWATSSALYFLDGGGCRVRKLSGGSITTIAGGNGCDYDGDLGPAGAAAFADLRQIAVTPCGVVLVSGGARVRAIYQQGTGTANDFDCDGITNTADNCSSNPDTNQANDDPDFTSLAPFGKSYNDLTWPNSDVFGNPCDDDDDNDGLADLAEIAATPCPSATASTSPSVPDSDGDRVIDGAECALGSDPANASSLPPAAPDADNDRLPDALDPADNDPDSDDDGILDGVEFRALGTNVLSPNTDGDSCGDARELASINADLSVNAIDLGQVAQAFGNSAAPGYIIYFDMTRDGSINAIDLGFVAKRFGACP